MLLSWYSFFFFKAFTTSPSISELKANLSLANFEYFEKDIESDEFRIKLEEAIAAIEERDELIDELKDQIKVITETVEDEKKFITHQNDLFVENECKLREAEKKIKEFVEELDRVKAECSSLSEVLFSFVAPNIKWYIWDCSKKYICRSTPAA